MNFPDAEIVKINIPFCQNQPQNQPTNVFTAWKYLCWWAIGQMWSPASKSFQPPLKIIDDQPFHHIGTDLSKPRQGRRITQKDRKKGEKILVNWDEILTE